jgi:hypothetical protein
MSGFNFGKVFGSNSSSIISSSNGNVVVINGVRHNLPRGNISINGSKIYVDGTLWDGSDELNENLKPLEITIEGNCGDIKNIKGNVTVKGDVTGDIEAGDSFTGGNITGDIQAGDSVRCGSVGGNVQAGDSVRCGDVKGKVNAGDSVHCSSRG